MRQTHDIFRQVSYIQQTLSQNKKPVGVFIAAGCPLAVRINHRETIVDGKTVHDSDALIPDVGGLTKLIIEKLKSTDPKKPSDCETLIAQMKDDGIAEPNIEHILTRIRSLSDVAGKGKVRDFDAKQLSDLEALICKIISAEVNKELPNKKTPYHNLAIWARSIERDNPVHIFTTNYDLLVEQAFEEESCPYFDGFIGARQAFFDLGAVEDDKLLHPRWARLWKIHGSINWRLDNKNKKIIRTEREAAGDSHLIYPSHLKYDQSRKMPYLAMLDRLKEFLMTTASALFISGYSFGDEHINNVISSCLAANPTAIVYAFMFGNLNDPKYLKAVECANASPNLSLIAFDKAIIGRKEGEWTIKPDNKIELSTELVHTRSEEGTPTYELRLGDFQIFGNFLKDLYANPNNEETKAA